MLTDVSFDLFILLLRVIFIFLLYFFLYQIVRVVTRELQTSAPTPRAAETVASPPNAKPPVLTVIDAARSGLAVGTAFGLEPVSTIGRTDDNVVVLRDAFVSSHHARLVQTNGRWYVTDLNSTNGTFINGRRAGQSAEFVKDGDVVQVGRVKLRLTLY